MNWHWILASEENYSHTSHGFSESDNPSEKCKNTQSFILDVIQADKSLSCVKKLFLRMGM